MPEKIVVHTTGEYIGSIELRTPRGPRSTSPAIVGSSPARIAEDEAVEARALYRRIYRCREKLRQLLEKKGVLL